LSPAIRLLGGENDTFGTTISLRDVTDRRRAEQRRLDFYSMIAHDLRSPMNAITLRAELMLRGKHGDLPSGAIADLRKVQENVHSLIRMINDFLDLARLEATDYKLVQETLDLSEVASACIDELRPLSEAAGLKIETDWPRQGVPVVGDERRLAQVLSNLLGNAIKFTPPGGKVRIRMLRDKDEATVIVEDTGTGIAPDQLERIFGRYVRGGGNGAGSGLGLLIVKEIVEAHGGTVGVDSTVGEGSRFWFRLALAPESMR
jgi:signal transduction histidine kinase